MYNILKHLFLQDSIYWRLLFVCSVLIIILLIFKFSEKKVIKWGLYLFTGCLAVNFLFSFYTNTYWTYMLNWFLSTICFLLFWYLTIYLAGQYGRPYSGDGAMIILLPLLYLMPTALFGALLLKGFIVLIKYFCVFVRCHS